MFFFSVAAAAGILSFATFSFVIRSFLTWFECISGDCCVCGSWLWGHSRHIRMDPDCNIKIYVYTRPSLCVALRSFVFFFPPPHFRGKWFLVPSISNESNIVHRFPAILHSVATPAQQKAIFHFKQIIRNALATECSPYPDQFPVSYRTLFVIVFYTRSNNFLSLLFTGPKIKLFPALCVQREWNKGDDRAVK